MEYNLIIIFRLSMASGNVRKSSFSNVESDTDEEETEEQRGRVSVLNWKTILDFIDFLYPIIYVIILEKRLEFEKRRKMHYREFEAVRLARKLIEEEDEDDEPAEKTDIVPTVIDGESIELKGVMDADELKN